MFRRFASPFFFLFFIQFVSHTTRPVCSCLPPTVQPPKEDPHPPGPLEELPVSLRYLLGEFLGPDDLLVVSMLGTAWFELGTSELLWYLQAVRLGSLGEGDSAAFKNQRVGLRDPGYCDGRAWAPGCLFAASWADFVRHLPGDIAVFAFVDFLGCPAIFPASAPGRKQPASNAARRHPVATAARLLPLGVQGREPPDQRPVVLVFWDPVGTINTYRVPQLLHLCALQAARTSTFPDVTHVVHARRKEELSLQRVVLWISLGYALPADKEEHALLKRADAWDRPLTETPEFIESLADLMEREKQRNEKRAARKKKEDAAAAEKALAMKGKVIRKIEGGDDDGGGGVGRGGGSRRRQRRGRGR